MTSYSSCNQKIKDIVNETLANLVCSEPVKVTDRVITLDDETNGTCKAFAADARFTGKLCVVQLDRQVAGKQYKNWNESDHGGYENDMWEIHAGNIIAWTGYPKDTVRLWNLDYVSLFHTHPTWMMKNFLATPKLAFSDDDVGTLVAFTFQAIPHAGLLAKLRTVRPDLHDLFTQMKVWDDDRVIQFYLDTMQEILALECPECVSVTPVPLPLQGYKGVTARDNALLYRGQSGNESVMMFMVLRCSHSPDCPLEHKTELRGKGKVPRKRSREDDELQTVEEEAKRQCQEIVDAMDVDSDSVEDAFEEDFDM